MKTIVNDVTEIIGNTPMIRLSKIASAHDHAEILGKLEACNPGGSIKDRPCLFMINEAERSGLLRPGATVIEPTSGNTGIGLAMICAVKGYRCILTMPESMSLERNYLLRVYGAQVVLTPTKLGMQGAIQKANELAQKIQNSYIPKQFDNRANAEAHRRTTAREILEVCSGKLDAFVAGVGTGGTISGVGETLKEAIPYVRVVAVEPRRSPVLSGGKQGQHNIQGIGAGFIPSILNRGIIDQIIQVDDKDAFQTSRLLGQKEGLCLGISSGANVFATMQIARELGPGKRVVTILCDTGERYFSIEQYFEA